MKTEISKYNPCRKAVEFRNKFNTFSDAWNNCQRGDWMLWIALKLKVDVRILTTAKALCANTVRHLMKDDRSKNAIDAALLFGNGEATIEKLNIAYSAADAAAADAAAANAANAAAYAAYTAADAAASAAAYAAYAAYSYAYADDARLKNMLQTANICRDVLTTEVFNKIKLND